MRTYTQEALAAGFRFAHAYGRALKRYLRKGPFFAPLGRGGPKVTDRRFPHWVKAAKVADELGVNYDDYVEAHFWAEHRFRGTCPKPHYLYRVAGRWTAADRVRDWREAKRAGESTSVVRRGQRARLRKGQRDDVQERYLAQLCARWQLPAAEILRAYGNPSLGVFNPQWLQAQALWQRLNDAGALCASLSQGVAYLTDMRREPTRK